MNFRSGLKRVQTLSVLNPRRKTFTLVITALLVWAVLFGVSAPVFAAQVLNRGVRLSTTIPNVASQYDFTFDLQTATSTGSIAFEFCSNSPIPSNPCTAPVGMDATTATIALQLGEVGFSVHPSTTSNRLIITRGATVVVPQSVQYAFDNILNTTEEQTHFVRISTHISADASGATFDFGSVAYRILRNKQVSATVPPILTFCVAAVMPGDCSTASGNFLDFGQLSAGGTAVATSVMSANTNASFGYSIVVIGNTMTSGNNIIPPLSTPTGSAPGIPQFGMNLRANSNPGVGTDPLGAGVATPTANFNIPNQFYFQNGATVVSSSGSTDINKFTATYVINVNTNQDPGYYRTTLSYLALATF